MSNTNSENTNNSYLIYFDDIECTSFKNVILNFLKTNGYENNEIKINQLYSLNIKKKSHPNWIKNTFYKIQNEKENNTEYMYNDVRVYRILIYKYDNNVFFFEKNGDIKIDKILSNYFYHKNIIYDKINYNNWKKINIKNDKDEITNLHNKIKKYFNDLVKNEIDENIKKINKKINIELNENDFNLNNILNKYNELINKKIDEENKLIDYKVNDCKTINAHKKGDEGEYNKLACNINNNKFICLDKMLIDNIEIGDIYNIDSNLIYHNKKNGDLRVLSSQIISSILMTRDDDKLTEYLNKYDLNDKINKENIKKCEYVFGLIQENKNTSFKDKLSIGSTCLLLDKINIKYHSDCINFIQETNDLIKSTKITKSTKSSESNINLNGIEENKKEKKNKSTKFKKF